MEDTFLEVTYFQKVSVLLHHIIIFRYYTYNYDYVSYTYFTVYVEVCVCFEIFLLTSGLCIMTWV